jgi:hypothetical protein
VLISPSRLIKSAQKGYDIWQPLWNASVRQTFEGIAGLQSDATASLPPYIYIAHYYAALFLSLLFLLSPWMTAAAAAAAAHMLLVWMGGDVEAHCLYAGIKPDAEQTTRSLHGKILKIFCRRCTLKAN